MQTNTDAHTHTLTYKHSHMCTHTHSTHTYCHAHYIHANTHTVMHNTYTQTLKYFQILIYTHTFTYKFAPIHLYSNMHAHQCITRTCIDILSVSSFCQLFSFLSFSPILSSLTVSISVPLNLSLFSISCTEHHLFLIYIPSIPISQLILDSPLLFPFLSPFWNKCLSLFIVILHLPSSCHKLPVIVSEIACITCQSITPSHRHEIPCCKWFGSFTSRTAVNYKEMFHSRLFDSSSLGVTNLTKDLIRTDCTSPSLSLFFNLHFPNDVEDIFSYQTSKLQFNSENTKDTTCHNSKFGLS